MLLGVYLLLSAQVESGFRTEPERSGLFIYLRYKPTFGFVYLSKLKPKEWVQRSKMKHPKVQIFEEEKLENELWEGEG